jgi:hypothetical protein
MLKKQYFSQIATTNNYIEYELFLIVYKVSFYFPER